VRGKSTTIPEHRPKSHREFAEWTPSRMIRWAASLGPHVGAVVQQIMEAKLHPEQGYRSCLGVIRLGKRYGNDRLEKACERALALRSPSYRTIQSILKTGFDSRPLPDTEARADTTDPVDHENIRGPAYYS